MKNTSIIAYFLLIIVLLINTNDSNAQQLRKVRAKKKIVAYDIQGNVIDSLTKDLKKQAEASSRLDKIQVELREIELELQKAGDDSEKTEESLKRKEDLLTEKLDVIKRIQDEKSDMVKEYYIIVESFKNKKNAKNALTNWHNKGYKVFLFENQLRKWYYICISVQKSYERAVKKQFELQKDGVKSWLYYWAE